MPAGKNLTNKPSLSSISRRQFLGRLSIFGTGYFLCPGRSPADPGSPLIKSIVRSPENTYFTYPHSNGFLADGTPVFASPTGDNGTAIDFIAFNPDNPNSARKIAHVTKARAYYCISKNNLMVLSKTDGSVAVLDLTLKSGPGKDMTPRQIFHEDGWTIAGDNDISVDGKHVVITRGLYDKNKQALDCRMDVIDTATGEVKNIVKNWQVDHAHFSPFDPSWISFCDIRPNNRDRMWVWNETQAPSGRHLFNQTFPDGRYYTVGHERAMFHKPALLTVAYGSHSTALPRGLFEVGFDGSVRLVSESNRDLHCNVSRDGRWAVVSLQGTYDPSGARANGNWLNTGLGYGFSDVMLVNMRSGARQFLYRGTNATSGQPYEVQPSISPDGRWVLLKDARERRVLMLEIDPTALASFLAA